MLNRTKGLAGLIGLAVLASWGVSFASHDTPVPAESASETEVIEWVRNGAGVRQFMLFDIYAVELYLPRKLGTAQAVLGDDISRRVRITLLRDISAERDVDFLLDGLENNNSAEELAAIQVPLEQFLQLIRALGSVAKGSVVELDYLPGVGTRVRLNRRHLATVPGAAFNRSVLKIWLGKRPVQQNLKRALLGQEQDAL